MKYAFVTGASRGLGQGFVEYLTSRGYFVFAGVQNLNPEYTDSNQITYLKCDVTDDSSIEHCVNMVKDKTSNLDLLINNAGVNKDSATSGHKELVCVLGKLRRDYLLKMFDVNSISPLMLTQACLPLLNGKPSFVINISSGRASFKDEFENSTANYGYRGSKAALSMYTFCSTTDLPENVQTFSVHPGDVHTDMNPEGNQTPVEQAEKIIAITENWQEAYNGKFMRWDGTYYPL